MYNIKLIENLHRGLCGAEASLRFTYIDKINEVIKECSEEELAELSKGTLNLATDKLADKLDAK